MSAYQTKIENWHSAAIEQLEIDFEKNVGNYWAKMKDNKQREIRTILAVQASTFKTWLPYKGNLI
jgi:hypothetical protein